MISTRRRLAQVVGVRLERQPEHADRALVAAPPSARAQLADDAARRWSRLISMTARSSCGWQPCDRGHVRQRLDVLREAGAAVADAGVEERARRCARRAPCPARPACTSAPSRSQIEAISLMKEILVARKALEAYLIISAVRRSVITTGAFERAVQLGDPLGRGAVVGAEHDAVGVHEVGDGRALAQELRVGDDRERHRRRTRVRGCSATKSPVPIGIVLLLTTIAGGVQVLGDGSARRRCDVRHVGLAAGPGGVLTATKTNSAPARPSA